MKELKNSIWFHIPMKHFSAEGYIEKIKEVEGKCTHLILGSLLNQVKWDTMLEYLPESLYKDGRKYPGAFSKEDFKKILKACKESNIKAVPDFRFFSHQRKDFLNLQDNLKAIKYAINDRTAKVNDEDIQEIQFGLMGEVFDLMDSKYAYIGHDESFVETSNLIKKKDFTGQIPAKIQDYIDSVTIIHSYLQYKGKRAILAADFFIPPNHFKGVKGGDKGSRETMRLLETMPRDIIMAIWSYKGVTSELVDHFVNKGFSVLVLGHDTNIYSQIEEAISGKENAHPGLTFWHKIHGTEYKSFMDEFVKEFPVIIEPTVKCGFWRKIKRLLGI